MEHETIQTKKLKVNFPFFGIASAVYAVFYTFCMYRNYSGITLPFFIAGSLLFGFLCMQKLEISVKKDALFYVIGLMLLSISSFCTDDGTILFFNRAGIFLLLICLCIHQFYEDKEWDFGKYFCAVFQTIFGTVGSIARPFVDWIAWRKQSEKKENSKGLYILLGLSIAGPLILLVGILLLSSDYVIWDMFCKAFENIQLIHVFDMLFIPMTFICMFFAAYGIIAYLSKKKICQEVRDKRCCEPVVMITITGLLSVIYVFYSLIQILYLFIGKMSLPEGYSYAEYAREGFFQLLLVCIFNLVLVLISIRYFKKSKVLKIILTIISACTYIMLASSALRMIMYIRFYYLTFQRILVLWTLAVLFILLTGLTVTIFIERFPLFRYSILVVTVCYLILSFAHPDYWIAKINTQNIGQVRNEFFEGEPYEDYHYLDSLSLDAASVVKPIFEARKSEYTIAESRWMLRYDVKQEQTDWRKFNLSRYLASKL